MLERKTAVDEFDERRMLGKKTGVDEFDGGRVYERGAFEL